MRPNSVVTASAPCGWHWLTAAVDDNGRFENALRLPACGQAPGQQLLVLLLLSSLASPPLFLPLLLRRTS